MAHEELPGIWLLEVFKRGGVDTQRLALDHPAEVRGMLRDPGGLPPRSLNTLLNACARLSGDESLGLHMIEWVDVTMLGTYGYLMANAPTVGRFLDVAVKYYPTLYRGAVLELHMEGAISILEFRVAGVTRVSPRHLHEWMLGFLADFIGRRLGSGWLPIRTLFANEAPEDPSGLEPVFGGDIAFNASRTAFEFETEILDRTINAADWHLLKLLTDQAETLLAGIHQRGSIEARIRLQILEHMERGRATSRYIALRMGMSRSTLKRRLAADGLTFRELRRETIREVATRALSETDVEVGAVALKLGYSELSAFDRAFRRITGMSPTKYRGMNTGSSLYGVIRATSPRASSSASTASPGRPPGGRRPARGDPSPRGAPR